MIMDYEKKYKEAIERLRNAFYDNNSRMCEEYRNAVLKIIEPIFPEITESEDERIRKKIIAFFKGQIPSTSAEDNKKFVAWLEKQGEQKQDVNIQINPSEYINDMGGNGCYLKNTTQNSTWSEEDELKRSTLINVVKKQQGSAIFEGLLPEELIDWLESLKDRSQPQPKQDSTDRFFEGFKKGEQSVIENYGKYGLCNPTKSKWSEEDELHIRKLEDLVKRVWAIAEHENDKETIHEMSDLSFFLKTLKPQLKQEWSKEDEDYFDAIIAKLEVTQEDAALTDNQMNFLKSLKSRVQPKQEWSEEEQQTIKDAASFILSCVNIVETKEEEERLEELADKLQDLRPQSHWKPTKEQMSAIEGAVNDWGFQRLHLNSLYEQLKKLREE